jgi:cytochrome c peroxidase
MTMRKLSRQIGALGFVTALLSPGGCGGEAAGAPHDHGSHHHGDGGHDHPGPTFDASVPPPDGSVVGDFVWDLPPGFPLPPVPADNPMSTAKVELGRHLFYDVRLSKNETQACASCHEQARAFTDGLARAVGSTGETHPRNAMGLANVAYASSLTWANPLLTELERQALLPILGDTPVELGFRSIAELEERFRGLPEYAELFSQAFPDQEPPITAENLARALATFQRTLLSGRSPFDRYQVEGDTSALSEAAKRGYALFNSERFECFHCHVGFNLTDNTHWEGKAFFEMPFHNTALYNIDGKGSYPVPNTGVHEVSGDFADTGQFKAPSLRNVAVTAPYMHDGSIATLEDVLDHYARGGRHIVEGPYAGDGSKSPLRDVLLRPFEMTAQERADVVEFLKSLTDEEFLTDPRFSNPWPDPRP